MYWQPPSIQKINPGSHFLCNFKKPRVAKPPNFGHVATCGPRATCYRPLQQRSLATAHYRSAKCGLHSHEVLRIRKLEESKKKWTIDFEILLFKCLLIIFCRLCFLNISRQRQNQKLQNEEMKNSAIFIEFRICNFHEWIYFLKIIFIKF